MQVLSRMDAKDALLQGYLWDDRLSLKVEALGYITTFIPTPLLHPERCPGPLLAGVRCEPGVALRGEVDVAVPHPDADGGERDPAQEAGHGEEVAHVPHGHALDAGDLPERVPDPSAAALHRPLVQAHVGESVGVGDHQLVHLGAR